MKFNFSKISYLTLSAVFLKKVSALDSFLQNVTRPELFKITDFNVPKIRISLNETEYDNLFLVMRCEMDTNPAYLKRNDDCYTAPWVNLNESFKKLINKKYLDVNSVKGEDKKIIDDVTNDKKKITLTEFEKIIKTYTKYSIEEIFSQPYDILPVPNSGPYGITFETDNASMIFQLKENNSYKNYTVPKVKFAVGGRSSKAYSKLSYNINIKKDLLFETKQLRLRADSVDPSYLREKIAYDLHNIIGLPSLYANYARLYINDKYMGFYLLRDAIKSRWIEYNFGEKDTKSIYKCHESASQIFNCENDDEKITDNTEFKKFVEKLQNVKTREELEEFFDVETFIQWQAARYLLGSLDHDKGKNTVLYMYHQKDTNRDIWIPLHYDFDMNFGNFKTPNTLQPFSKEIAYKENPLYPIYKLLKLDDNSQELISIMDEIMRLVFNPNVLIPRIDQLKYFVQKYVKDDLTEDANGKLPGRFDIPIRRGEDLFDYNDFEKNSDFTTIQTIQYKNDFNEYYTRVTTALGLKQWVIERFKYACSTYHLDCSYADTILSRPEYSEYKVKKITHVLRNGGCKGTGYACCIMNNGFIDSVDADGTWGVEGGRYCLYTEDPKSSQEPEPEPEPEKCWSLEEGYPCCKDKNTPVTYISKTTGKEWGKENGDWCGITDLQKRCPTVVGYACCKSTCTVSYNDGNQWGIEDNDWCVIPYECDKK